MLFYNANFVQKSRLDPHQKCSSAHYWARRLEAMGHTARLMAPQFVKPYVNVNAGPLSPIPPE